MRVGEPEVAAEPAVPGADAVDLRVSAHVAALLGPAPVVADAPVVRAASRVQEAQVASSQVALKHFGKDTSLRLYSVQARSV